MSIKTLTIAVFLTVIILFSNTLVAQEKTKKKTKNLKIGLTLSGGAASGLAHIGVLQAIDDAELNIDYISGTSMGAIIGALYAIGYSGKDIEKIVTSTDFIEIFQDKPPFSTIPMEGRKEFNNYMLEIPIKNLRNIIPTGLIEGQTFWLKLSSLFAPVYNVDDFSKFSIPFKAIAADLEKGEVLVLDKGNIANALRASAAIPYIFTPIEINGIQMIDGGIVRNFPVINTIESGATYNIGVNVGINDSKIKLSSAIEILSHLSRYQNMFDLPKEIDASDIYIYLGPYDDIGSSLSFSKSGVKKILDKGKKMTEVYYHTFKALADSLKKDDPNYKFKRNRLPKTDDTIIIKKIAVSNLEKSSQENFIKTLGISLNKGYTIDQINSYIKKLLGKHFYKNIRYNFEKDDQGDYTTINFYAQEVDKNYFKAGLFFNNTSKTTLKLNVTSRDLLTRESTFIFTAYIGRYPTFSINNVFYNNPYDNIRLVTLGSLYKRSIIPPTIINNFRNNLYNQILDLNINEDYTSINGNIYYEPIQDLSFNIFSAFSFTNHSFNIYNNIETTDTKVNSKSMFFTIGPSLEIDTRDKKFFPSKGVFWNVNAFYIKPIKHSYLDKTYGHNSDIYNELKSTFLNSYGSIQMYSDLNWYLPMTNFLVLNLGTQLGLNFNFRSNDYPINLNQSFLIGGINQNINRNQITFIGLSDAGFIANNAAVGMVNLQIRPIKNFYVSIKGNYLGYYNGGSIFTGMEPKLKKMYGSILGAGVSLTYTSPIGPLQFTMMQSPKYNNTLLYVNLGLAF